MWLSRLVRLVFGANLKNKNSLKNHLSNNLKISGVPKALKNTVLHLNIIISINLKKL